MTAVHDEPRPTRTRGEISDEARHRNDARREDLAWMADNGENVEGAAKRLDMKVATLSAWCYTHGASDVWERLRANAPLVTK